MATTIKPLNYKTMKQDCNTTISWVVKGQIDRSDKVGYTSPLHLTTLREGTAMFLLDWIATAIRTAARLLALRNSSVARWYLGGLWEIPNAGCVREFWALVYGGIGYDPNRVAILNLTDPQIKRTVENRPWWRFVYLDPALHFAPLDQIFKDMRMTSRPAEGLSDFTSESLEPIKLQADFDLSQVVHRDDRGWFLFEATPGDQISDAEAKGSRAFNPSNLILSDEMDQLSLPVYLLFCRAYYLTSYGRLPDERPVLLPGSSFRGKPLKIWLNRKTRTFEVSVVTSEEKTAESFRRVCWHLPTEVQGTVPEYPSS